MKASLPVDEMNRIVVEVGTGKKPAKPDTPEMAKFRESMQREFEQARANGKEIQIPSE